MTLTAKIITGFGSVLFMMVLLIGINKSFSSEVQKDINYLESSEEIIKLSTNLENSFERMQNSFRGFLLTKDTDFIKEYYHNSGHFDEFYSSGLAIIKDPVQKSNYLELNQNINKWRYGTAEPVIHSFRQSDPKNKAYTDSLISGYLKAGNLKNHLEAVNTNFAAFNDYEFSRRSDSRRELTLSVYKINNVAVILALFILMVGVGLTIYLSRDISHRMNSMVSVAEQIANGEWEINIKDKGKDEMSRLAEALNTMTKKLHDTFTKLEQKNKALDLTNRDLEHFAYAASHDLKEPVRMISNYTQLLADKLSVTLDENTREYIHYAVEGSHRIKNLINDLLEYVRITQKEMVLKLIDLKMVVQNVSRELSKEIEESGAVIKTYSMPTIFADPSHVHILIRNILDNAIKFRSDKPLVIEAGTIVKDNEKVFYVKDNGIGLNQEYEEKAFTIFQRLNDRESYPGTGIGLTICKKIIEIHEGRIWIESQPGNGTTVYFTLPVYS